jgi:hypothetical protein
MLTLSIADITEILSAGIFINALQWCIGATATAICETGSNLTVDDRTIQNDGYRTGEIHAIAIRSLLTTHTNTAEGAIRFDISNGTASETITCIAELARTLALSAWRTDWRIHINAQTKFVAGM